MTVYQIKIATNEIVAKYSNVVHWGGNFVEFNNGGRCKCYCGDDEYFTDIEPKESAE